MKFPANLVIDELIADDKEYQKSKIIRIGVAHYHTLTFRISGEKRIRPDGMERPLVSAENGITYIPRGIGYEEETVRGGRMLSLHFSLQTDPQPVTDSGIFLLCPRAPAQYRSRFEALSTRYRAGAGPDYGSLAVLYELFSMLYGESHEDEHRAMPRRMRLALKQIGEQYDDPELTVAALAQAAGISEVWFRREFHACTGMAPREYIRRLRLEHARALIATAVYPISEIALRCGFDSISYFSAEFRRAYGMTPSQWMHRQGQ